MTCTLTILFSVPGYQDGTDTQNYTVADGSYTSPYATPRPDLGYNGSSNNVYTICCNGSAGVVELATYYPGYLKPTITSSTNSCPPIVAVKYDCINGACIPKTTYNTPGIYQSLSECETACGTGCSGKCVSNSEWAQIEGLSNQLKNRNCG
ncbi:hypothetical protein CDG76_20795 [Nostoc sp. 'Peltigera membranacea cyanobiont' 210A]|uniref:hypothetical protein n=1 Tax=Nostoc sp. 'Peltigera membranacea cyanobiont' 210A TaxID=2014529 RepID=UPI000B955AE0|nr:hypothetical protein [Nostoc sp. 'Peltigera membranacea cyanobiont' 210A]OYD93134.1 hypothetical protein CDG76_20795 [Nostoc sp. 'Peltigera membranacea cyanobiont' 210A]